MTPKERHRNLEPPSAEFICALAGGCGARRLLEIGGSSGLSTIALAAAARRTGGRLVSIEIEPTRQALARQRLRELELADHVDFVLADAGRVLGQYEALELVLIDCEKDDYVRFLGLLKPSPGAVVRRRQHPVARPARVRRGRAGLPRRRVGHLADRQGARSEPVRRRLAGASLGGLAP